MSTWNLYPYNLYVLYLAIAVLAVYIIILAKHLLNLGKTIRSYQPEFASIQVNAGHAGDMSAVLSNKHRKNQAKMKELVPLALLLMSIRFNYKANLKTGDITHNKKREAAAKTIRQLSSDPRIIQQLKSTIGI
ncbi:MAG: hypothetical protein EOM64_08125 [Erysipelotrichia bacterium]|nr:hypothetical protein [Erysipelotrichia bacterium]